LGERLNQPDYAVGVRVFEQDLAETGMEIEKLK
jgi:hypothetical protein